MSRKKRKSNFEKLAEAHMLSNYLDSVLFTLLTGELPRKATLDHILMLQKYNKLKDKQ